MSVALAKLVLEEWTVMLEDFLSEFQKASKLTFRKAQRITIIRTIAAFEDERVKTQGILFGHEMGFGKTIMMAAVMWYYMVYLPDQIPDRPTGTSGNSQSLLLDQKEWDQKWAAKVKRCSKKCLIVTPFSSIEPTHVKQLGQLFGNMLHVYHGSDRDRVEKIKRLNKAKVIITTYGLVLSHYNKQHGKSKLTKKGPFNLFSLKYLVLGADEIQMIKNGQVSSSPKQQEKCHHAVAFYKMRDENVENVIGITGTAVGNVVMEIASLARGIGAKYCNWADRTYWVKADEDTIQKALDQFFIRYTREECADMKPLLPKKEYLVLTPLTQAQFEKNSQVILEGLAKIEEYKKMDGQDTKKQGLVLHIFHLLQKLRQICSSPFTPKPLVEEKKKEKKPDKDEKSEEEDEIVDTESFESEDSSDGEEKEEYDPTDPLSEFGIPDADILMKTVCKLIPGVDLLEKIFARGEKVVIFGKWYRTILIWRKIIHRYFPKEKCLLFGGVISEDEKNQTIDLFRESDKYTVFLSTIDSGNISISLVAANNVFILDGGWNPAVERQAVCRVYREGQTRETHIYRFVTDGHCGDILVRLKQNDKAFNVIPRITPDMEGHDYKYNGDKLTLSSVFAFFQNSNLTFAEYLKTCKVQKDWLLEELDMKTNLKTVASEQKSFLIPVLPPSLLPPISYSSWSSPSSFSSSSSSSSSSIFRNPPFPSSSSSSSSTIVKRKTMDSDSDEDNHYQKPSKKSVQATYNRIADSKNIPRQYVAGLSSKPDTYHPVTKPYSSGLQSKKSLQIKKVIASSKRQKI